MQTGAAPRWAASPRTTLQAFAKQPLLQQGYTFPDKKGSHRASVCAYDLNLSMCRRGMFAEIARDPGCCDWQRRTASREAVVGDPHDVRSSKISFAQLTRPPVALQWPSRPAAYVDKEFRLRVRRNVTIFSS